MSALARRTRTPSPHHPRVAKSRRPKGDGSIFRGSDGVWRARHWVIDPETGAQRRVQVRGTTKTEASRKLAALRTRVEEGQPARDGAIAFERYAERWLRTSLPASSRKQTTQILYAGLTRRHLIGSDLGQVPLDRLAPRHIESLLLALRAKGLSDSTVRQVYTIGRAIGDAAVRDGALGRNPFAAVPRPRITRKEAAHLTVEQVRDLLEAASSSRYRLLFELMVNTGLRRGEALALRWADVDIKRRTLFVRGTLVRLDGRLTVTEPKTTKARRTVPLSREALATLERLRVRRDGDRALVEGLWHETGFVFTTQDGEPCEPRNALRALKVAATTAGLGDIGLHTLRHSAATVMLNHGVPINVVSSILGHSGIEVTVDIYGHVAPHVSLDAVGVLSDALAASRGDADEAGVSDTPSDDASTEDALSEDAVNAISDIQALPRRFDARPLDEVIQEMVDAEDRSGHGPGGDS